MLHVSTLCGSAKPTERVPGNFVSSMCLRPCGLLLLATAAYAFQLGVSTASSRAAPRRLRQLAVCQQLDFESMRLGELRSLLKARGVSIEGCFDRDSLVERADQFRGQLESVPVPAPPAWPGGEPVEQGPESGATASLILLHGFGDSGNGMISSMGGPLVAMPGLRVIFPSAAPTQVGGFAMSSWLTMAPGANPMSMMRAGDAEVATAVAYVHDLIRREMARGVPSTAIAVGGFSQGGLVAARAALSFQDEPLGGCLALSTFFGADAASVAAPTLALGPRPYP